MTAGDEVRGDVTVAEASFDVLVQKIEHLTIAVEKIEERWEKRHEAEVATQAGRDGRLRAVELELAVTKTKVLWIVAAGSFVVSAVVSIVASIAVAWLGK